MGKILTKPYKRWEPGTLLTSNQEEFSAAPMPPKGQSVGPGRGAVYVNAERLAQLEREGYFDAPAKEES